MIAVTCSLYGLVEKNTVSGGTIGSSALYAYMTALYCVSLGSAVYK